MVAPDPTRTDCRDSTWHAAPDKGFSRSTFDLIQLYTGVLSGAGPPRLPMTADARDALPRTPRCDTGRAGSGRRSSIGLTDRAGFRPDRAMRAGSPAQVRAFEAAAKAVLVEVVLHQSVGHRSASGADKRRAIERSTRAPKVPEIAVSRSHPPACLLGVCASRTQAQNRPICNQERP